MTWRPARVGWAIGIDWSGSVYPLTKAQDRAIVEGSGILGFRPQHKMLFDK